MRKLTEDEKKRIAEAITDLEINIEHTRAAPMLTKAKHAETAIDSSLVCMRLMAGALGVDCG